MTVPEGDLCLLGSVATGWMLGETYSHRQVLSNAALTICCQGFKNALQCLHTSEIVALYVGEFRPSKSACNTVAAGETSP